ncbi:MAG: hypothetical protein NZ923_10680 [Candidatus Kryptonium sp.]|nr:hypothetical protein [Candidatus Kryptonium sp.]
MLLAICFVLFVSLFQNSFSKPRPKNHKPSYFCSNNNPFKIIARTRGFNPSQVRFKL